MRFALGCVALLAATAFAGCLSSETAQPTKLDPKALVGGSLVVVHDALGRVLSLADLPALSRLTSTVFQVGADGPEPSIGITAKDNVFFQANEKTYRSKDHGRTWQRVGTGPLAATSSSDPFLWVDPVTSRVFQINMGVPLGGRGPLGSGAPATVNGAFFCSQIAWSDDEGVNWTANPIDCGVLPGNDHEKLTTGPFVPGDPLAQDPVYPNVVYYSYNKAIDVPIAANGRSIPPTLPTDETTNHTKNPGGWVAASFDGGMTFPQTVQAFPETCNGGLHGAITAGPDGTVYVPARNCPAPLVAVSRDNGLTWTRSVVGESVGVPEQQKNPEIAVDRENNAYLAWVGKDNRVHVSISTDHASTWGEPILVSPPTVGSAIWPAIVAGDKGRVGIAYVGTEDSTLPPWNVANGTRWHLYYTSTLDAFAPSPIFATIRATQDSDPVQRGTICVQSDKCKDGNRNLLDFIDLSLDRDGRPYVAYADGCTSPQCLRPDATPLDSRSRQGMVMVVERGPGLYADKGELQPFE